MNLEEDTEAGAHEEADQMGPETHTVQHSSPWKGQARCAHRGAQSEGHRSCQDSSFTGKSGTVWGSCPWECQPHTAVRGDNIGSAHQALVPGMNDQEGL